MCLIVILLAAASFSNSSLIISALKTRLQLRDWHYEPVLAEKPREIAVDVLRRHAAGTDRAEVLLEDALQRAGPGLSAPDRGLARELAFGVIRWQAALDWLIARRTDGRPQKVLLQILLRLGLYQLFWLDRVPDHAAVHETVELAKRLGFGPKAGFVNALLRGCVRERDVLARQFEELKASEPHVGFSHPRWLCDRWAARWDDGKLRALLDWNNTPPHTFIRVNTLRATPEKLAAQFEQEGVLFTPRPYDWAPGDLAFELREHPPLTTLPSFQQGLFYVQDPSTLLAARLLDPQPGERVLDLCAAPGGKTTLLAQFMGNRGCIVAEDSDPRRLKLVAENCARLGVTCVEISLGPTAALGGASVPASRSFVELPPGPPASLPAGPPLPSLSPSERERVGVRGEGKHAETAGPLTPALSPSEEERERVAPPVGEGSFDRVLIDAPCSNTGVLRRRVDLRWRIQPVEIDRLRKLQIGLLRRAAARVKPGGLLVYSTCSLEPEENENVVQELLAENKRFRLESQRQLLPFNDRVDGAYVARLCEG
jgi:16S rRNA (cytosine967-C5)-methyltransferase